MKVSVSFIKNKYNDEKKTIEEINYTSADYIHVDIMDGKFVPTKNYTFKDIYKFVSGISKPLDVHLMCEKPEKYVRNFAMLNTEFITFHLEATDKVNEMIDMIHSYGIKCGISIKPNTSVKELLPYLDKIELVLIMSVEPGKGGQKFIPIAIDKINELRKLNKNIIISVDGGINQDNIYKLRSLVDMLVIGSYLSTETKEKVEMIRNIKGSLSNSVGE